MKLKVLIMLLLIFVVLTVAASECNTGSVNPFIPQTWMASPTPGGSDLLPLLTPAP